MTAKLKNPFLLAGFHSKAYFCDREQEMETLFDHFNNDRNVMLYAWRRIGKTALIEYFLTRLEQEKQAHTLYIDLMATKDMKSAIEQITEAVYNKFGKTKSGFSAAFQRLLSQIGMSLSYDPETGLPTFTIANQSTGKAEHTLNELGSFLKDQKKQVIIAIDEFQKVSEYTDMDGEAVFRSWTQQYPTLRFIFSGSHRHLMASMFLEKNRPFYKSTQLLQLNPIALGSYQKFIQTHFTKAAKTISNDLIAEIYEWSRGQTYTIQLICNKLYGSYDQVNTDRINKTYDEIIAQEAPVLVNYSNLLTHKQWDVLTAVAREGLVNNPHSQSFISKNNLGAASSVSSALSMLVNKEIIIKEEDGYKIHDVILMRWLQSL